MHHIKESLQLSFIALFIEECTNFTSNCCIILCVWKRIYFYCQKPTHNQILLQSCLFFSPPTHHYIKSTLWSYYYFLYSLEPSCRTSHSGISLQLLCIFLASNLHMQGMFMLVLNKYDKIAFTYLVKDFSLVSLAFLYHLHSLGSTLEEFQP